MNFAVNMIIRLPKQNPSYVMAIGSPAGNFRAHTGKTATPRGSSPTLRIMRQTNARK